MIAAPCESADKVYGFTDSVGSRVVGESSDFGAAIEFLTGIRVIRISNVNMVRVIEVGVKCHSHKTILTCGLVNVGERCTAELCAIDHFLIGIMEKHEKMAWMLRAHLSTNK